MQKKKKKKNGTAKHPHTHIQVSSSFIRHGNKFANFTLKYGKP